MVLKYSMQEVCKISRGGKRKKKEGRGKEKEKKKEEGRREDRRRKKEKGRKKEGERTAALVMEASLTGLGGQGLAWSHIRSAS